MSISPKVQGTRRLQELFILYPWQMPLAFFWLAIFLDMRIGVFLDAATYETIYAASHHPGAVQ